MWQDFLNYVDKIWLHSMIHPFLPGFQSTFPPERFPFHYLITFETSQLVCRKYFMNLKYYICHCPLQNQIHMGESLSIPAYCKGNMVIHHSKYVFWLNFYNLLMKKWSWNLSSYILKCFKIIISIYSCVGNKREKKQWSKII